MSEQSARQPSPFVSPASLATALTIYRPGHHDLRIGVWYGQEDPLVNTANVSDEVLNRFEQLYPLYRLVAWAPANDYRRFAVKKQSRARSS